ncbi:MAG: hypothetical protein M1480_09605 [Bacteroidetes bacterium]|nr:hypothetical protein [Bacteroidota bacterium]
MKTVKYLVPFVLAFLTSCSSLVLKPADFSWPIESVSNVGNNGNVEVKRYSLNFDARPLFIKETGDSLSYQNQQLRVIRNSKGYYFMVANNFKNVYVFNVKDGVFKLEKKIEISKQEGIQNPAFNQRPPYIELVYGSNSDKKLNLSEDGIEKEEVKK